MALQRKEGLVKLAADDGKKQETVNRELSRQQQEQSGGEHDPKGDIDNEAIDGQDRCPISGYRLAALSEVAGCLFHLFLKAAAFGKCFQEGNPFYIFHKDTHHIGKIIPGFFL